MYGCMGYKCDKLPTQHKKFGVKTLAIKTYLQKLKDT
jgi:hypothetical protein